MTLGTVIVLIINLFIKLTGISKCKTKFLGPITPIGGLFYYILDCFNYLL